MQKTAILTILSAFVLHFSHAQTSKFTGDWVGELKVNVSLKLVFHVSDNDGLAATMDSPDQATYGLKSSEVQIEGDSIFIKIGGLNGEYRGHYQAKDDTEMLLGTWFQSGFSFPLNLTKNIGPMDGPDRPQHPKPPFPYKLEDVRFSHADGSITLAGTITLPENNEAAPAVILITGSGPQDRDETIFHHKPFWVIADYLTRRGIAVLRFDDRGYGESTGNFSTATSRDFSNDVMAGVAYLKSRADIDPSRIGLIGHSEGGVIGPMVAAKQTDIAFMILLAGTAVTGSDVLKAQTAAILESSGVKSEVTTELQPLLKDIHAIVIKSKTIEKARKKAVSLFNRWYPGSSDGARFVLQIPSKADAEAYAISYVNQLYNPWMRQFLQHDPVPELLKSSCPVLAIFAEKDIQVIPAQNKQPMMDALAASRRSGNYDVIEIPGVNHLFQHCSDCTIAEYGRLTETFAPEVLELMSGWLERFR